MRSSVVRALRPGVPTKPLVTREFEGEHDTTPREDNAQAATKKAYGYTIFQDEVPKTAQALAHEFGHALGLNDRNGERDQRFLMYHAINTATGYAIPKADVHTVNSAV